MKAGFPVTAVRGPEGTYTVVDAHVDHDIGNLCNTFRERACRPVKCHAAGGAPVGSGTAQVKSLTATEKRQQALQRHGVVLYQHVDEPASVDESLFDATARSLTVNIEPDIRRPCAA